jgi:3-hydroxyacyl-CoA dehydrogenase
VRIERVGVVGGGTMGSSVPIVELAAAAGAGGERVQRLVAAGLLGRKSGRGLLSYV